MTIKKTIQRQGFKTNEFVVYSTHGVGQIVLIEEGARGRRRSLQSCSLWPPY